MSHAPRDMFHRGLSAQAGTSVLAALVFVAILSSVAYAVHEITIGNTASQSAAAGGVFAIAESAPPQEAAKAQAPVTPAVAPTSKAAFTKDSAERCVAPIKIQQGSNVKLDAASLAQDVINSCVPGCDYEVYQSVVGTSVHARDLCAGNSAANCKRTQCIVQHCDDNGCYPADTGGATPSAFLAQEFGVQSKVLIQSDPIVKSAVEMAKADPATAQQTVDQLSPVQQQAFQAAQADALAKNQQAIKDAAGLGNQTAVDELEAENRKLSTVKANSNIADTASLPTPPSCASDPQYCPPNQTTPANDQQSPAGDSTFRKPSYDGGSGSPPDFTPQKTAPPVSSKLEELQPATTAETKTPQSSLEKLKSLTNNCPANSSCPLGGLPTAKFSYICGQPGADSDTCMKGDVGKTGGTPQQPAEVSKVGGSVYCKGNDCSKTPTNDTSKISPCGVATDAREPCSTAPAPPPIPVPPPAQQDPQLKQLQQQNQLLQQQLQQQTLLRAAAQSRNNNGGWNAQSLSQGLNAMMQGLTMGSLLNNLNRSNTNPYQNSYQQQQQAAACPAAPVQPPASECNGTWVPQSASVGGQSCTVGWTCSTANNPTAKIDCSPLTTDDTATINITYSCGNSSTSNGHNFTTGGATSGQTSTVLPPLTSGSNTIVFGVQCTNAQGQSTTASCSVSVTHAAIVMVANPPTISSGQQSTIGWVTTGMQSCVVSSLQDSAFTLSNAASTATSGSAKTSALAASASYALSCTTIGGASKTAATTVTVK